MQRDAVDHEKAAWLNYKGYCLFRRMGNHGVGVGVFLGDDRSRELWQTWMEWRGQLLAMRKQRRR